MSAPNQNGNQSVSSSFSSNRELQKTRDGAIIATNKYAFNHTRKKLLVARSSSRDLVEEMHHSLLKFDTGQTWVKQQIIKRKSGLVSTELFCTQMHILQNERVIVE